MQSSLPCPPGTSALAQPSPVALAQAQAIIPSPCRPPLQMSFEYQATRYCDRTPARGCKGYCQVGQRAVLLADAAVTLHMHVHSAFFSTAGLTCPPPRLPAVPRSPHPRHQEHYAEHSGEPEAAEEEMPELGDVDAEGEDVEPPAGGGSSAPKPPPPPLRSRRYSDSTPERIIDERSWSGVRVPALCCSLIMPAPVVAVCAV